ncbi:hypothetical protein C0995_009078 [Termitomyces sp. Mi166|nr:hypothetical protein C0995_009078 [Termitomyces sp. Mi166\
MALEHIKHAGKRKAPAYEKPVVEPKWARALEFVRAPAPTVVRPPPPHVQPPSSSPTSMPVCSDPVMPRPIQEPDIPAVVENPLAELLLEPRNEIMADAPAMQQGQRVEALYVPVMDSQAGLSSQEEVHLAPEIPELKAQPVAVESCGLSASLHVPDVLGPTKHCRGQKPPLDLSKLDVVDFSNNVQPVAMIENESDYGQFSSEDEQKSEEGESAAQCVQRNKKLTMKKVKVAKAEAAQQHWAINDFSGCIPDRLGVKVWGLLNVERLNLCFRRALSDCMYYSPYSNTVHIGANANWAVAFEFNSHQQAKVPTIIVYKYALRGLPCTPYELEQLYKYYANEHVPQRNRVVAYMLISELLLFAQQLDNSLQDRTMQVLLSDPLYQDLKNPI